MFGKFCYKCKYCVYITNILQHNNIWVKIFLNVIHNIGWQNCLYDTLVDTVIDTINKMPWKSFKSLKQHFRYHICETKCTIIIIGNYVPIQ